MNSEEQDTRTMTARLPNNGSVIDTEEQVVLRIPFSKWRNGVRTRIADNGGRARLVIDFKRSFVVINAVGGDGDDDGRKLACLRVNAKASFGGLCAKL
jgi:hypothetical protein